jgi:acyl-CoA thioester hydrolase
MELSEGVVREDWIDYNGHLYDGYYAVIFARATDEFLVRIGLDAPTREATRRTVYTLETHVRFLREMKLGAPYRVDCRLIDHAPKLARTFLTMHDTARNIVAATSEQLLLSVDQSGGEPKAAPWLAASLEVLQSMGAAHARLPMPEAAGKGIAIRY